MPLDEAHLWEHRPFLWGLCYRMTGVAADADDLVQETFARALAKPPRLDAPIKPYLTQVALNLARDALRRRKRQGYVGPWLPSPIETDDEAVPVSAEPPSTEGRYDLLESVSFGFLLALEALTPKQRAVLLLRDVFDYSVKETAHALGVSEDDVKTTHLRARRAMAAYDAARSVPTREMQRRNRAALERLMSALLTNDVAAVERELATSVRHLSDGGGEFLAARVPVIGAAKVARFLLRLLEIRGVPRRAELKTLNGFPAVVAWFESERPKDAPIAVLRIEADGEGRVREVHTVLASRKLTAIASA